jgi:hypothetical protein
VSGLVAIDARAAVRREIGGVERVAREMAARLPALRARRRREVMSLSKPRWWLLGVVFVAASAGAPLLPEPARATLPHWNGREVFASAFSSPAPQPFATFPSDLAATSRAPSSSTAAITVTPHVGGPRETFIARFRSLYPTYGEFAEGAAAYYELQVRGPRPCRREGSDLVTTERLAPGDSVVILISLLTRTRWCRGRYHAWIDYVKDSRTGKLILRRRITSSLAFRVVNRQPRSPFSFSPRVGGPRETFVVRFVSPFRTFEDEPLTEDSSDRDAYYRVELRGPRKCRRLRTTSFRDVSLLRGDRVLITLFPTFMTPSRRQWCPGRYVGRIDWVRTSWDAVTVKRAVRRRILFRATSQNPYLGSKSLRP